MTASARSSKAIDLFHKAIAASPAYRKLVKAHRIDPAMIVDEQSFATLPIIDKKSFIYKNSLAELHSGKMPPMVYASSGSSGKPTYWFRDDEQEVMGGRLHEQIFSKTFGIRKEDSTLAIVCFSMGLWVAGSYTAEACRYVSRHGYNLTVVTPGIEFDDIAGVLENLAPLYKNVILLGYPPFLTDVLLKSKERKIKLPRKLFFLTAGDKVDELWRNKVSKEAGITDILHTNVNVYGCADAVMLGFETPLTIFIRRATIHDKGLYKALFGNARIMPSLFQYDTREIYFEEQDNELLFTANTVAPLVRYNIHDIGSLRSYDEMLHIVEQFGYGAATKKLRADNFKMPFIIKHGRTDVAVTTYALNIYPEHIQDGLSDAKVRSFVSGNYVAYNSIGKSGQEELYFNIELMSGKRPSKRLMIELRNTLVKHLLKVNMEYRKLYQTMGQQVLPIVRLFYFGDGALAHAHHGLIGLKGKKPKVIL